MESRGIRGRRVVVLADGRLDFHFGKTAIGLIRYRPDSVVAVIDRTNAGRTTAETVGFGGSIPIVASLDEALAFAPTTLVIGVATRGGNIPPEWRPILVEAVDRGLDLVSGLHEFLADDKELAARAKSRGVWLVDIRKPPQTLSVATGRPHRKLCTVVTTVGSDCAVGKMSVALDIESEANGMGAGAYFLATGQTGMMIAGNGIPVDRIIGDFMAGAVEEAVDVAARGHDIVLVEGQGSILHPGYSGITLALIHGSQPDALILTVMPARSRIDEYDVVIPPVPQLVQIYEAAAALLKPAPVIGVAVNTHGLDEADARRAIVRIEGETGLPATDTFRFGAKPLAEALLTFHETRTAHITPASLSGIELSPNPPSC